MQSKEFEYNGYVYEFEDDYEDDNIKRFHYIYDPNGSIVDVDISPYKHINYEEFKEIVNKLSTYENQ